MGYCALVHEFSRASSTALPNHPTKLDEDAVAFIRRMVADEMDELESAESLTGQADALVDAVYFLCDCACRNGINLDPLFEIVHRANMQKIINGNVLHRDDGKIMKPQHWKDPQPELEAELSRQNREGSFS